ncbi:unnamed protein product [Rotaria sordida]|uniref:Uncharacterized protein n=1 Tax=Rotaria sordida TaxID=392033 RepID=A0A815NG26_9BILA|nr:unnamed protein product [Rotaria sordida]CAF1293951.1 unnamed protein product [Rotaria sordida]CAF1433399.1 unnamed protein product [Rotaria sordida]CAF3776611.1 unnamed protein product [Rotaria sordida]CAF4139722.1 unnamed protein product [Rotaria sordida]
MVLSQQTMIDVSTQAVCTQTLVLKASGVNQWAKAGLDTNVDWNLVCGDIIAFKLEWFPVGSGKWSDWYVVGVNDIDSKTDGQQRTAKRMWAYFADHRHTYIVCRQKKFKGCNCKSYSDQLALDVATTENATISTDI